MFLPAYNSTTVNQPCQNISIFPEFLQNVNLPGLDQALARQVWKGQELRAKKKLAETEVAEGSESVCRLQFSLTTSRSVATSRQRTPNSEESILKS